MWFFVGSTEGNIETHQYNPNDNVIRHIDRQGQIFTKTYNKRNWLMSVRVNADGQSDERTFAYNAAGQKIKAINATGKLTYDYHPDTGELVQVTYPDGKTVRYENEMENSYKQMTGPFGCTTKCVQVPHLGGTVKHIGNGGQSVPLFRRILGPDHRVAILEGKMV